MKRCPSCNRIYDDAPRFCSIDATPLVAEPPASVQSYNPLGAGMTPPPMNVPPQYPYAPQVNQPPYAQFPLTPYQQNSPLPQQQNPYAAMPYQQQLGQGAKATNIIGRTLWWPVKFILGGYTGVFRDFFYIILLILCAPIALLEWLYKLIFSRKQPRQQ